jgi:hypothetical protein
MASKSTKLFSKKSDFILIGISILFLVMALLGRVNAQTTVTFATVGSNTWVCPTGVTSVTVQCWGAGGGGGSNSTSQTKCGGGGGGAYSGSTISVTHGTTYYINVGAGAVAANGGDSWFNASTISPYTSVNSAPTGITLGVLAVGGKGVTTVNTTSGGAGGLASNSYGATKWDGGTGGTGSTYSGSGGGGAGSTAVGGNGSGTSLTGGTGGSLNGGTGGAGRSTNGAGNAGTNYGAGGGGSYRQSSNASPLGASGTQGYVTLTYTCPRNYTTLPYSSSFEGAWGNSCSSTIDIPDSYWSVYSGGTTPNTNDIWHRSDYAGTDWTSKTSNQYKGVALGQSGSNSATFNNYYAPASSQGAIDLNVNLSPVGNKTLSFYYINPETGASSLIVQLSTDGGATFSTTIATLSNNVTSWTLQSYTLTATSATSVIRFLATSDYGTYDLGIDNLSLVVACTSPTISTVTPTNPSCNPDGSVTITTSGIVTDYSIDNGSNWTASASNTYTFTSLAAGTYNVKVKNTDGCVTTYGSNPVTLTAPSTSAAPVVTSPICAGSTSVSGTSTEVNGTTIEVFKGGVSQGTTTVSSNAWTKTSLTLAGGDVITAKATASGKCVSAASGSVTVNSAPSITGQPGNQMVTAGAGTATFTVTATGGGLTYQWQESTNGGSTWSNVSNGGVYSGAISASLVITNPAIGMNGYKYRCAVSGCSPSATSDGNATLTVTLNYCTPAPLAGSNGITRVVFNTIDNSTSGTNGYQNYTASQSTTLTLGSSYNLSVYANTGGAFNSKQRAWIDWNQDGDFADTGEQYDLGQTYNVTSGLSPLCPLSITVSASATVGTTRLRVSCASGTYYADPCENGYNDEFEDYTIVVQSTPTLSASALTGFGNVATGTTAGPNSFTITGLYLSTENVTVGPLTGYTFSTTSGGTYTSSLSIPQSGGSFSQTIYVEFSPVAVQSYNGNIPVGGGGATSINVPVTGAGVAAMAFSSCTSTQTVTSPIAPFTNGQQIIGVQVVTTGSASQISATSFTFNTTGCTAPLTDIICATLYCTGTSGTFSVASNFGSVVSQPNGTFTFSGDSYTLFEGTNYFWLAYNVPLGATIGDMLDAECTSVTVASVAHTPSTTNPGSGRPIANTYLHNSSDPVSACSGMYTDDNGGGGGNGTYSKGNHYAKTFVPSAGNVVRLTFTSFSTETADEMKIYDGPSTSSTLIGTYKGSTNPGNITATSATGELTVDFNSDAWPIPGDNPQGWEATISCVSLPPNCASYTSPSNGATSQATNTSIVWVAGATDGTHNAPTSYKLYFGTDAAATNIYNGTNIGNVTSWGMMLNVSTTYYWKIVPVNASGEATGCSTIYSFTTAATVTATTITVCPSGCDKTTIKSAYDACTTATPYIIKVKSGYAGEMYPIAINNDVASVVSNRSAANPVIIHPDAGFSYTFLGAANKVFEFSGGTKNITIDGRQGGAGTTANGFTFQNTSTTTSVVNFGGDCSNITVEYCKIQGGNQSKGLVTLASPTGSGIRNITIDNNEIYPNTGLFPSCGIYCGGTSTLKNTNISVTNNLIHDIWADVAAPSYGIDFDYNIGSDINYSCTISGNSVYFTSTKTPSSNNTKLYGIYCGGINQTISNNYVGGTAASCGATALTISGTKENHLYGILVKGYSAASKTTVTGNTVRNISLSTQHRSIDNLTNRIASGDNQSLAGISIEEGSATVSNNTIGGTTAGDITVINTNINAGTPTLTTNYQSSENDWGYSAELAGLVYSSKLGTISNGGNSVQGLKCYSSNNGANINCRVIGVLATTDDPTATGYIHNITNDIIGGTGGLIAGAAANAGDGFVWGIRTATGNGSIYINHNTVSNLQVLSTGAYGFIRGIHNDGGLRCEIENNTVTNLACASPNSLPAGDAARRRVIVGIMCDNDGGFLDHFFVNKNLVYDLRSTTATSTKVNLIGIYYRHADAPTYGRVFGNKVYSLNASSTDMGSILVGIWAYGQNTITYNNMITLGSNVSSTVAGGCPSGSPGITSGYELRGIENNFGKNEFYYNSVDIIGTAGVGASNSYAYKFTGSSSTLGCRVMKDNIFSNTRSSTGGGGAKHYAFSVNSYENCYTSDYNYFYVTGTNGVLFDFNGTDESTIALWRTAAGQDAHSIGGATITSDPLFVDPSGCSADLNITSSVTPIKGVGTNSGIPSFILDDYYGTTRSGSNDIGAVVSGGVLPVELISFNASKENKSKVRLDWVTASETNNDYFTIERSADGLTFETLGKIDGAGSSNSKKSYNSFDYNPLSGINYYRLKQTDFDGKYSYSQIESLDFSSEELSVNIYPNPFNNYLNIDIQGETDDSTILGVYDMTGKTIIEKYIDNENNHISLQLDQNLPNGFYFVKIFNTTTVKHYKVIKRTE